jgi:hypothetical protein
MPATTTCASVKNSIRDPDELRDDCERDRCAARDPLRQPQPRRCERQGGREQHRPQQRQQVARVLDRLRVVFDRRQDWQRRRVQHVAQRRPEPQD